MRILWLNANLLLPLDKGGKLRTWHVMRQLARRHEITYLSFVAPGLDRALIDGMREVCARVETVRRQDRPKASARFYADVLRHLVNPLPYAVAAYRSRRYAARLRSLLDREAFDLLVCDFLVPAVNVASPLPCPSVLFTHNVEAEIWRRHAETQTSPLRRTLFELQWRRMLRFEKRALERFGLVLAVSEADRQTFARLYGPASVASSFVVETGVDTDYFAPAERPEQMPRHLVFTGSMDWIPNEDAMVHFVRAILPLVRREEPGATLSIVGRAPTAAVRALADEPGIDVTGTVDDVRPEIAKAAAYIVPIRIGGGTRLKIFEAMSMGRAVVSTTIGAEGLPVTPNHDILIADNPEAFAAAVVELLRNPARRRALEAAARALVVERYDWAAVGLGLEKVLVSYVENTRPIAGRAPERRRAAPAPVAAPWQP